MELLKTIAILCHIGGSPFAPSYNDNYQLQCQQLYLNCVLQDSAINKDIEAKEIPKVLVNCVLNRRII
jgi:hypothetical protein